ncbi:hypothetical protein BH11PLA1_BH11PLA1_00120 [soil metagenome]
MNEMNESLADLQDALLKAHALLRARLAAADSAPVRRELLKQLQAAAARVQTVGGLLFAQQCDALDAKVADVRKASTKLKRALADTESAKQVVATLTDFFALVDEAIDLAKTAV